MHLGCLAHYPHNSVPPACCPLHHRCNRSLPGLLPFGFDPLPATVRVGANRRYCLTLRRLSQCADPSSPCCSQSLAKVEWWSRDACRGSVKAVYLDGVKIDQQWANNGTFKVRGPEPRSIERQFLRTGARAGCARRMPYTVQQDARWWILTCTAPGGLLGFQVHPWHSSR